MLDVEGCLDLDLEGSLVTNVAPVRRLALAVGQQAEAPAAYVHHRDLTVERLEQSYRRLPDRAGLLRFDYRAPGVGYHARLAFGRDGLVVSYPRVGARLSSKATLAPGASC